MTSLSRAHLEHNARFDEAYFATNYVDYDAQNPSYKLAHYRSMVERHVGRSIPRRLHDVGCAYGRFVGSLDDTWDATGSDVSRHAVEEASRRYPKRRFAAMDAARPWAFDGPFGVVTSFDMLEHVHDCDGIAERARERLVPGGLFVFVVPAYDGATAPLHRLLDRDPTHVNKWPRRAWLDWASRRFRVLSWHGILRYLLPGNRYLHVTTRRFRAQTPAIIVACERA